MKINVWNKMKLKLTEINTHIERKTVL